MKRGKKPIRAGKFLFYVLNFNDRIKRPETGSVERTNHLPDPRVFILEAVAGVTAAVHENLLSKFTNT